MNREAFNPFWRGGPILGQLQPPPQWGGGTTPPPSEFMSHGQWQRTRDARDALCQLAERYGPNPEVGLEEAYEGMMNVLTQLEGGDIDAAIKHAVKRCPDLLGLMHTIQEARRKKEEEERLREYEEEVRARDPVASRDPYRPDWAPLPPEGRPEVPSPPVYGPRTPEPELPARIPDIAFRPGVRTQGSPVSERLPTETGVEDLPMVPSVDPYKPYRPTTPAPPVGEPVATGGRPAAQQPFGAPVEAGSDRFTWNREPVATGGGGGCPPGQFWDGRKCRGSVDTAALQQFGGIAAGAGGAGTIAPAASLAPSVMPAGVSVGNPMRPRMAGIGMQYLPSMRGGYSPWW